MSTEISFAHLPLLQRADILNCDVIFTIKRIRALKTLAELDKASVECLALLKNLNSCLETLDSHPKHKLLFHKSAKNRLLYAEKFLTRELAAKRSKLERAATQKAIATTAKSAYSASTAKILARFIIKESLKLNEKFKPNAEGKLRVSTIPDAELVQASKLAALLTEPSKLETLSSPEEENFLEGMDELL